MRGEMFDAFDVNGDGRRRARQNAMAVYGMGDAAGMPELGVNDAALGVYGGGNFLPGGNLRFGKYAGSERAAERIRPAVARWACRFCTAPRAKSS